MDYKFIIQVIVLLVLAFNLGIVLLKKPVNDPLKSVYCSSARTEILSWLRTNLKQDEKYSLGPNLNWQLSTGVWILPPFNAKTKDFKKFNAFMERHNVSYVIIDSESLSDKSELIKNYFEINPAEGLIQKKAEPKWELIYKDHNKPVNFMIFKILPHVNS